MVERRLQVLITWLRPLSRQLLAFLSRYPSTNGPFPVNEPFDLTLLSSCADGASDMMNLSSTCSAGALALGRLAPRGDRVTAAGGAAFTATVRVIDRVHRDTANRPDAAPPARAPGLAVVGVHVVGVRHRADGCPASACHQALLARLQTQDAMPWSRPTSCA
jgi:hypothetical protein